MVLWVYRRTTPSLALGCVSRIYLLFVAPSAQLRNEAERSAARLHPTGKSEKTCPALDRKIFPLPPSGKSSLQVRPILSRQEGRIMIVTKRGRGCGGRGSVGAQGDRRARSTRERFTARRTNDADAYGKTVWFRHPLLVSSCRWLMRSNRIGSAIKPAATVTRRIRRRGEHGISRKAIARGMPECFR